ncbi:hypothetical protein TIFTF001_016932 [Ficus carica]|uniref:Uncharacterized protein n=1 Tax=Ficus carica TaxID=3494 RepID=A0AA88D6M0_FICCA|nr:hypothetical protein TIFTF001_016932 [Ficus carica]
MMMAASPKVEGISGKGAPWMSKLHGLLYLRSAMVLGDLGRVHDSGRWGRRALGSLRSGFMIRATVGGLATVDGGTPAP